MKPMRGRGGIVSPSDLPRSPAKLGGPASAPACVYALGGRLGMSLPASAPSSLRRGALGGQCCLRTRTSPKPRLGLWTLSRGPPRTRGHPAGPGAGVLGMTGGHDHAPASWGQALSWLQRHPRHPGQPRKFRTRATRRAEDGGSERPQRAPYVLGVGPRGLPTPQHGVR